MHNGDSKVEKAPGVRAKKGGSKLKRGEAVQVMCYPREKTKSLLVEASRELNLSLSSFMVLSSLKEAAALRGCDIADLGIAPDELRRYRRSAA